MTMTKEKLESAMLECETYGEIAAKFGVHIKTVTMWAKRFDLQRLGPKKGSSIEIPLDTILAGEYPQYPTYLLKRRLIKEGLLLYKCCECNIAEWNGQDLTLELDHKDGNRYNHKFENLRLICPNCHSQTKTYKSKNKKLKRETRRVARDGLLALP